MIWTIKPAPGRNQEWHRHFAWFPVCVTPGLNPVPATYAWLETVERCWEVFEDSRFDDRWEYRRLERVPPGGGDEEMWSRFGDERNQGRP